MAHGAVDFHHWAGFYVRLRGVQKIFLWKELQREKMYLLARLLHNKD